MGWFLMMFFVLWFLMVLFVFNMVRGDL